MRALNRVGAFATSVALGSVALFVGPGSAEAQITIDLVPFVGSFYSPGTTGYAVSGLEEKHENVLAVGGALGVQLTQVIGVEARATYVPSGVRISPVEGERDVGENQGLALPGRLFTADGIVRFHAPRTNFYGLAGAGVVSRSGDAWTEYEGLTDVEVVAGAGVRARVTQSFRLDIRVEGHFYSFEPQPPAIYGWTYDSKVMADFLINIGFPIPIR